LCVWIHGEEEHLDKVSLYRSILVWVVHLACSKPSEYGDAAKRWTIARLAKHIREHAAKRGILPWLAWAKAGFIVFFLERTSRPIKPPITLRGVISKETTSWLKGKPNRFEFIYTPKHGSWLDLIEIFFSKMTRAFLRSLRVTSKAEVKTRIEKYLDEVNAAPVVFKWEYKLDEVML
jgi:hypothetical protein